MIPQGVAALLDLMTISGGTVSFELTRFAISLVIRLLEKYPEVSKDFRVSSGCQAVRICGTSLRVEGIAAACVRNKQS